MIYFTRQEQRIIIVLGVVILLGTGVLMVKRFHPGWAMQLSMGEPDFDVERDEKTPRLKSRTLVDGQEQNSEDDNTLSDDQSSQARHSDQSDTPDVKDTRTPDTRININTASKAELETLPGIGPVLAQRIIEYRQKYGGFMHIRELTGVRGIGEVTLEKLKDRITVQ